MTIKRFVTSAALVGSFAIAAVPAYAQHRGGGGHSSSFRGSVRVAPRVYSSRGYDRSYYRSSYYRPYYSFRPRTSLGFGLWLGYPVTYPAYYYDAPYAYSAPYPADPYGYQNQQYEVQPYSNQPYSSQPYSSQPYSNQPYSNQPYSNQGQQYQSSSPSVGVQRGYQQPQSSSGGVSFEITPQDADVFVDGRQMGQAGEFGPSSQPLDLSAGRHRVEIRARGYRTMNFEADVVAGQVIPVQGTLQRN